jgi:2-keto-4-pentenoate hydratase/2-oxohepta-3-ene-1,7-dioic acid hydratase in catechol pathway
MRSSSPKEHNVKLASFEISGRPSWGVIEDNHAIEMGGIFPDLRAFIATGQPSDIEAAKADAPRHDLTAIRWLPVIPNPDKIICVGVNYESHRRETGRSEVENPTIFVRFFNTQIGNLENIVRPHVSTQLDYEGELAVVIGRGGRYILREDALDHVAGYACYNDATLRDWQRHTHQFTPGKNFPATGGFGPWLVTPDEVGSLDDQKITTRLNGQIVQEAGLHQMIFDVPHIIEYCSAFTHLEPGDVIATGTPGGVGFKRDPQLFMKPGDTVEVAITSVGVLTNGVADEPVA